MIAPLRLVEMGVEAASARYFDEPEYRVGSGFASA
jgi:hypothetical protein